MWRMSSWTKVEPLHAFKYKKNYFRKTGNTLNVRWSLKRGFYVTVMVVIIIVWRHFDFIRISKGKFSTVYNKTFDCCCCYWVQLRLLINSSWMSGSMINNNYRPCVLNDCSSCLFYIFSSWTLKELIHRQSSNGGFQLEHKKNVAWALANSAISL